MNRFSSFKHRFLFVGMLAFALGFCMSPISNVWAEGHAADGGAAGDKGATADKGTTTPPKSGCSQIGTNSAGFGVVMLALVLFFFARARSEARAAATVTPDVRRQ